MTEVGGGMSDQRERMIGVIGSASPWFARHPKEQAKIASDISDALIAAGFGDVTALRARINDLETEKSARETRRRWRGAMIG